MNPSDPTYTQIPGGAYLNLLEFEDLKVIAICKC